MTQSARRPRRDEIADAVRAQIVSGALEAGTRIREERLAADHGVSRVPVREALLGLEQEGYLVRTPRRGVTVATPSPARTLELMVIRRELEVLASRLAALRRGGAVADELRGVVDEGNLAVVERRHDAMPDLIERFHALVAAASGNETLVELLAQLRSQVRWMFEVDLEERSSVQWAEHAAIMGAILAGDARAATRHMNGHVARDEALYERRLTTRPA